MLSFSAGHILMFTAGRSYDSFITAWWVKVWAVQSLIFSLHKSPTFWTAPWQTTLMVKVCSPSSPSMAVTLQEASSSQMDYDISIHNSLKDAVSLYFIIFNTFWFETKFWEAHQFSDSGATSYYNLVFLPQNITKDYCPWPSKLQCLLTTLFL